MEIIKRIIQKPRSESNKECNYSNNYYGDQVCMVKPAKPSA